MNKWFDSLALLSITAGAVPAARAQVLPSDFVAESVGGNWNQPTCICFAGTNDLLVAEKAGLLWDVQRGFKHVKPVIDLQQEILDNGDRGLLSVAVDPQWASNGYIYLLYVVDPNGDGNDWEQETFGRLTRYTTSFDINGDLLADPGSRKILIGATWPEGIPSLHYSHSVGDLRFAADGTLLVSTGDGAHWDVTDIGGFDPNGFGSGKFDRSEDIGAFRSQSTTSLAGKILRIDPATGDGLPDNPFFTGNAADNQSRVWIVGLRNPFRFCLDPGSGSPERLYVGDVGWFDWEEFSRGSGGENMGWPCWEGAVVCSAYHNNNPFGECNDASLFTPPLLTWNHTDPMNNGYVGNCVCGVCVYNGTEYPQKYVGRLFYCDYGANWIRSVPFVNDLPAQSESFASAANNPVDLIPDPVNGDLYYIAISTDSILHLRYTKANHPPVALATLSPSYGALPLVTSLDASASYDPEGGALTYDWDLGDGTHSSLATLTRTYPLATNYQVTLTVTDVGGESSSLSRTVAAGDTPPTIRSILSPAPGSFFVAGKTLLTFAASVRDAEDDQAGIPLGVQWIVNLVHDHHVHPSWAILNGAYAQYTPPVHDEGVYLHVVLVVTDSRGLQTSQSIDLFDADARPVPHLVDLSKWSPRVGNPIRATGHLHYAGHGAAELAFDWGDGTVDRFFASHMEDCQPTHLYVAPGDYSLRLTGRDGAAVETVLQTIHVRPLAPAVAIFAPLVAPHYLPIDSRWLIATELADDLHAAGFEAQIFGSGDQDALKAWLIDYLADAPNDWLVLLDEGASVAYAGQNRGSLAETWLEAGNSIAWTGCNPFSVYLDADGNESQQGAGPFALDEILDAASPQLDAGAGTMILQGDGADLPALQPFASSCALMTAKLDPGWTIAKLYASDGLTPPVSDALAIRNPAGGEYAQFYCVDDATLPREAVLRDFFLSHVYAHLPAGPERFALESPPPRALVADAEPTLVWGAGAEATSWLVEVATDPTFATPVFTATVVRSGLASQRTASVQVTPPLEPATHYFWRVTARNDFGTQTSGERGFRTRRELRAH